MSRKSRNGDSLELLLDTICNTFGGILFIAMLVILMLQLSGDGESDAASTVQSVSAIELATLRDELAGAQVELQRLHELHAGQQRTLAAFAPPELSQLVDENLAMQEQVAELVHRRDELVAKAAAHAAEIAAVRDDISETTSALQQAEDRLASVQKRLERDREERHQELQLSQVRSSSRVELGLVVQYGRLYVWHHYDRYGFRQGLNTDEFLILEIKLTGAVTTPNPLAGVPLDSSEQCRRAVLSRLEPFSPDRFDAAVIVRPDSFAEFAILRDILRSSGFRYRLIPTEVGEAIVDRGGSGGRVQ